MSVGLEIVLDGLLEAEILGDEGPLLDELRDRLEGEVGIDRAGAVADQQREVRDLARLTGLDHDAAAGARALADQMVVNRARREQHRQRSQLGRHVAIAEHEQVRARRHRLGGLAAQPVERRPQARRRLGRLERRRERARFEAGQRDVPDPRQLFVRDHGAIEPQQPRVLRRLGEQVALLAERGEERHHRALEDRVDRRIRHLREQLLEVVEEQPRTVGQARQRRILAHRADGFLAVADHRRDQDAEILAGVAEDLLAHEARLGIRVVIDLGAREIARASPGSSRPRCGRDAVRRDPP